MSLLHQSRACQTCDGWLKDTVAPLLNHAFYLKTFSWIIVILLAVQCFLCSTWIYSHPQEIGTSGWLNMAMLLLAFLATCMALSREFPWQNVVAALGIIASVSGFFCVFSFRLGSSNLPDSLWKLTLFPVIAILNSRGIARLALKPWRQRSGYGVWVLGLTVLGSIFCLLLWETFTTSEYPGSARTSFPWILIYSAVTSFAGTFLASPFLINKRPYECPPTWEPVIICLVLTLCFGCEANLRQRTATAPSSASRSG